MVDNIKELTQFSKTLEVLYVEDNEEAREQTVKMLKNFFTNIIIAIDGKDGVDKFIQNKNSLDIVFTDINMPNMNGIEMLNSIRKIDKNIPCIVLSAHNEIDFFLDTINLGIDGYILKPIDMKQFLNILSKTLSHIQLKKENIQYKQNLEFKVEEQILELREKDKILFHQSRLAAMGEMIDAIAHQWKQPLNLITTITSSIAVKYDMELNVTKEDIIECAKSVEEQAVHLADTIDEFRTFFRPSINKVSSSILDVLNSTLNLLDKPIKLANLDVDIDYSEDIKIEMIPNEFKHIFINLINNTIDVFAENNITNRQIKINIYNINDSVTIDFLDNAGGIPQEIINTLFNANVTTKKDGKGTGIGLYMTKQIIEKNDGTITAENINNGALFKINFKYKRGE